VKDNFWL